MVHKQAFFLPLLGLLVLMSAAWGQAMEFEWARHQDHERIVFEFESAVDGLDVQRTGSQKLSFSAETAVQAGETLPEPRRLTASRLIQSINPHEDRIELLMNTDAFGFVSYTLPAENKLVVDIFRDPLGAQWEPLERAEPVREEEPEEPEAADPEPEDLEPKETGSESAVDDLEFAPGEQQEVIRQRPDEQEEPSHKWRGAVRQEASAEDEVEPVSGALTDQSGTRIKITARQNPVEAEDRQEQTTPKPQSPQEAAGNQDEPVQEVLHPDLEEGRGAPADYEEKLLAAKALMNSGQYREAVDLLEQMRSDPGMPENFTEDVLYAYAEANFQRLRGDIRNNFTEIITPFERAMHYDPGSERVPEALLNLGYVHLQVGNEPEARGYFNLLRDEYPDHPSVPSTYFYWGDYYEKKGMYQQAADAYERIVQDYPEDDLVKPAALRLARALSELDFHAQALDILRFIETRWPRYYIDDPDYLNLAGYIMYRNDKLDQARQRFLHYINLRPEGDQVAVAMARIGDIYLREGKKQAAKDIHEETVRKYPDEEGGLIAAMRLAEEGIYDDPEISDFDRPFSMRPRAIYKRISEEFPESPLAPVALLKLAMWDLTHGYFDYQESLDAIQRFYEMYKHKDLWPRALEVGFEAFSRVVEDLFPEEKYKDIIDTYESYPFLNENPDSLSDDSRLALATSYWNTDNIEQALVMAEPFLEQEGINESNQAALSLILSIYMETADWEKVLELADRVSDWDLPREDRLQVRYARALALQNLERGEEALPIWRELAVEADFSTKQKAHALFFLARNAYNEQDYKNTYVFAQESLALFMEQEEQNLPRIMTCLDMLMDATAETGRVREALVWALEYQDYIDEEDPDWPAFQYRLARMYRLNHRYQEWEDVLGRIIRDFPDSVYSRMARSELKSRELTREAEQYQP